MKCQKWMGLVFVAVLVCSSFVAKAQTAGSRAYTLPESYHNSLKENQKDDREQSVEVPTLTTAQSRQSNLESTREEAQDTLEAEDRFAGNAIKSRLELLAEEFEDLKASYVKPGDIVGYSGGFFIKSRDGNYKLQINGRVQMKYSFNIAEDLHNKHSFILRRAFLMFHGNMHTPKLSYFFLLVPHGSPSLGFLTVKYAFHKAFGLEFTYDNPVFGQNFKLSSARLHFIGKSIADLRYALSSSLGLVASGGLGRFSYNAGIWNGFGTSLSSNTNQEMMYHVQLKYNVLHPFKWSGGDLAYTEKPGLSLTAAGALFHLEEDPQALVMQGTASFDFKYRGLHLNGAGFFRFTDPDQFTVAQYDAAFVAEAGYFILKKKLEIAARVSALFDDLNSAGVNINMGAGGPSSLGGPHGGGDVGGDSDNEWQYSLGVNYYWRESYNSKIQFQYSYMIDAQAGVDELVNHIGQVKLQVAF